MRFGRDYHRRFVPEWTSFYVRYDLIKSHLKSRAQSFDGSLQLLSGDIGAFLSFHNDQITVLACQEASLWALFDNPDEKWTYHPHERDFLVSGLKSLAQEVLKLNWFDRVNHEAIDKLFEKLHRVAPETKATDEELSTRRSRWEEKRQAQQLELSKIRARLQDSIELMETKRVHEEFTRTSLLTVVDGLSLDAAYFRQDLINAINGDERGALAAMFWQLTKQSDGVFRETSQLLLKFFIVQRSWRNILYLLQHMGDTPDGVRFGQDSIRLLIIAHAQETPKSEADTSVTSGPDRDVGEKPSAQDVLVRVLEVLDPANVKELFIGNADNQQPPLHLLAKHGLSDWCCLVIGKIQETGNKSDVRDTILSMDSLKLTPLHYALIHRHPRVTNIFSEVLGANKDEFQRAECREILGNYLNMAVVLGDSDVVTQISPLTNLDNKSIYGTSPLHLAAREGRVNIISHLLHAGANVDMVEHPRGWTPLFEAAVNDCMEAVQHLLDQGANATVVDRTGWTAQELATYRGHLAIAELLNTTRPSDSPLRITHAPPRTTDLVKRGATDSGEVIVSVNLGPMQVGRHERPVQLGYFSADPMGALESLYTLRITGAGQTHRVRLPILEDRSNVPLLFTFPQGADLQLAFKIFRDDLEKGDAGILEYGGTALLESNKLLFGSSRQSLVREHTVSVLDSGTLDIAGSILFTYVIAKPFAHLQSPKYSVAELRNGADSVTVIGHRGLGQNVNSRGFLQIGENTVESFIAAENAGASFVEFDVQVTKDLQPIIYHDFSLSETGTDTPIHDVTVDQYKYTSSVQASQSAPNVDVEESGVDSIPAEMRPRSQSLGGGDGPGVFYIRDRLKHTVDFKTKGMKSNIRGQVIQQPLATLKDLFHKLPKTVGFNIEIKYPRFHETVAAGVAPIGPELNLFVDTVLEQVHFHGGDRRIILSSFTPEICILLSAKQKAYPVLFITNAGKLPMIDVERRAASMQVAIRFAKLWGLAGIVFASEPLVLCPRLVGYVKSSGLVCASYGPQNSLPGAVMTQARAGIDVLIVDRVRLVAKTLKELA